MKPKRLQRATRLPSPDTIIATLVSGIRCPDQPMEEAREKIRGAILAKDYPRALSIADTLSTQLYGDVTRVRAVLQLTSLIRKVPFQHESLDPEAVATKTFHSSEWRCRRQNDRYRARKRCAREGHGSAFAMARDFIRAVLGEEPPLSEIFEGAGFGPGASVGAGGDLTTYVQKLSSLTVTPVCAPYARAAMWQHAQLRAWVLGETPQGIYCHDRSKFNQLVEALLLYTPGNKIGFVDKTAKTKRTIATEPTLNGFVQKGVDVWMRARLASFGIDLTNQQANSLLAWLGSQDQAINPWVTVDMRDASNLLPLEFFRDMLPPAWFNFLNNIRSPSYQLNGKWARYEKFVSMGNGFCFPLQTLCYAAICYAATEVAGLGKKYRITGSNVKLGFRCYGDDLIVPQSAALYLIELLKYCGFDVNVKKTHVVGGFRESCGESYYGGQSVHPYTLDMLPKTVADFYVILNQLRQRSDFSLVADAWAKLHAYVPPERLYYRPVVGNPDTAIDVPLDVFMASKSAIWDRDTHRWKWKERKPRPVNWGEEPSADPARPAVGIEGRLLVPPVLESYGYLNGGIAHESGPLAGRVVLSHRRWTTLSTVTV